MILITMQANKLSQDKYPADAKKVFRKLGTCSRTFFHILDREFGNLMTDEERAADPLAGGIMQKGYQCGMLWGASLAAGAEAYRTCKHSSQAIIVAVEATKLLMSSFERQEQTTQCSEITKCDFSNNLSFAKYLLSGRFLHCYQLAEDWAPEAVEEARLALAAKPFDFEYTVSCASELVKKIGASDEEVVMVAGFAGGLGLSGSGCGALSAALWMSALYWCRMNKKGSSIKDPRGKVILNAFLVLTKNEFLCKNICKRTFDSIEAHSNYISQGGCENLIHELSSA